MGAARVVATVLPYNWPISVMANKILPALLAGNAVVVKSPPTCPGTVLLVAAAMADLPSPGVLNVVNGPGAALGAALVSHPGVDMVSFTGGSTTGQAVMGAAAATTRPVVLELELGGNDAAILAPDLEVNRALADRLVGAAFDSSGQICMAIKRLYVQRERLDDLVAAMEERSSIWSNDDALAADVAARLEAGTVFVNAHGISAIDMHAPMGGWKQSGFGLELGTEGMQAYARQRVTVRRPGQGSWGVPA